MILLNLDWPTFDAVVHVPVRLTENLSRSCWLLRKSEQTRVLQILSRGLLLSIYIGQKSLLK